jgi:2-polyprenyl-3-methyl-5-hydroxy-6-metoxy-1,4-benzoquinol methylase
MNLLAPARRFDPTCPELIDDPGTDRSLVQEELRILERMNRLLGGCGLVLQYARRLLRSNRLASLSVLDLGTGAADIPRAMAAWAKRSQLSATITAVDRNPEVLRVAQEACRGWPEIRVEQHDLRDLPYAANSYDLVCCSLTLHHLERAEAVQLLGRMQQIARIGYVVSDLRRNWLAVWLAELLARTVITSEVLRHDGTQSCRAAFTVEELRTMAQEAGLKHFRIKRHHGVFRMVLEGRNEPQTKVNHG